MAALEIQSVIDRIGPGNFNQAVRSLIDGDDFPMEALANNFPPSSRFRQELRKAVRWVVEHGMPEK